jgi:hypothetical protein
MRYKVVFFIAAFSTVLFSCKSAKSPVFTNQDISKTISKMSAIMIHDVTNPPLAARFYAYTCLAGYEVVAENDAAFKSMKGKLNSYPDIKKPAGVADYDYRLSAMLAMMKTAEKLQPSGSLMSEYEQKFLDSCDRIGFNSKTVENSVKYADTISKQILAYAKADKYNRISNYARYTPPGKQGTWEPTPPVYMAAVEPYFNTIRPFTLDSASQFLPVPPLPFSTDKNSGFYRQIMIVYKEAGDQLTPEQRAVAGFWDCNPFAVENRGHLMIGIKKISPGAHWMAITGIACKQKNIPFSKAMQINTAVAIGLMDGFICCWDAKYHFNLIRPETAIRKYVDPNWKPLLQTPPFPEYLSGHSVVSCASATILTHFFGPDFHYTDDVEKSYGIPPRTFTSFRQAADEAAISRLWGGIHFKDAIEQGKLQGEKVGKLVVSKI